MSERYRPIIGMPVQRIVEGAVFSQSPEYSWSVEQAGGVPLLIPLIKDILPLSNLCDGFIITGQRTTTQIRIVIASTMRS
jgi:gamma-glutamyl-gamma-aminobutyrate hydrolase PuuD